MKGDKKIEVKLSGGDISSGKIYARTLGHFLLNFQSLIEIFSPKMSLNRRVMKNATRLFLSKIESGSVILHFQPSLQETIYEDDILTNVYEDLIHFTEVLITTPNDARKLLLEKSIEDSDRLKFELTLQQLMTSEYEVSFISESKGAVELLKSKISYVENWIKEDSNVGSRSIKGVLLRIKGDGPSPYFTMKTHNGSIVKCYYNPDEEGTVLDFFKRPLIVVGIAERNVKFSNLTEIMDMSEWTKERFSKLGHLRLKRDMEFEVSYEDEVICLSNHDLRVTACAFDYKEAVKRLETNLIEIYDVYVHQIPQDKLGSSALKLVANLKEIVGEESYGNAKEKRDKGFLN